MRLDREVPVGRLIQKENTAGSQRVPDFGQQRLAFVGKEMFEDGTENDEIEITNVVWQ
jgi:hypothetical protein